MKMLFFLLVFFFGQLYAQKRINWNYDPVNLNYNGKTGMITIKLLYNTKVSTQGHSGKWTTGMTGTGLIVDVDSIDFFTPTKKIDSGIVYSCGNPTKFHEEINRGKIVIVKKITTDNTIAFIPLSMLPSLLKNKGEKGDKGDSGLNGQDGRDGRIIYESSSPTWPWIVGGGVIVATVAAIIFWPKKTTTPTPAPVVYQWGGSTH